MHSDGSISIHGRSDSTLNRQGVRLGSSDFYDVLETMDEISETLVVGVDQPDDGYWLGLFVVPAEGHALDDALREKIAKTLRSRSKNTPFDGWTLRGGVAATIVGGRVLYTGPDPGTGRLNFGDPAGA